MAYGMYKPYLVGTYTPEEVLQVLEAWIDWHAWRLAETAPGQVDNLYYEDLAQEGRLAVYRLVERDPHMWAPRLLRLAILYMYAARRRGRSVFRADPYHRLRTYEQVSLEVLADGEGMVAEANEGLWEEGRDVLVVPSSCGDGCGVEDVSAPGENVWW